MKNLLTTCLAILLLFACKKEPKEEPNPCCGETPVKADFGMMNGTSLTLRFVGFYPDVAFAREFITFKAIPEDPEATYTWYLGSEVITGSTFQRDFSTTKTTGENNIPITMVIRKTPNKECFPNDEGYDSITKTITLVDDYCDYLTNGDFKVLFTGAADSSIVRVRNWNVVTSGDYSPDCDYGQIGIDFDFKNQLDTNWNTYYSGTQFYSSIIFDKFSTTKGDWFNGYFKVNPSTLKASAEYNIYRFNGPSDRYSFKGRKIN